MAESERIQGSNPTLTVASTSRKRFGSDANAKRFQEALLSLDLFPARSIEPLDDLDANASTSLPVEPASETKPTSSEEKLESSEEGEEEQEASVSTSVTDSYPLLCNPVSCRAPEGEANVQDDERVAEIAALPQRKGEESERAKSDENASEQVVAAEPVADPETPQQSPIDSKPSPQLEPQIVKTDSEMPTAKPQEVIAEAVKSQDDTEPVMSELQSTKGMEEDRGRDRPKQKGEAKSTSESRDPAPVQPVVDTSPSENRPGVAVRADLEASSKEELAPNLSASNSDLQPKGRRADRLERDRKSGGEKAESIDSQSEGPSSEYMSDGIEGIQASLDSEFSREAVVSSDPTLASEITTAGFTESAGPLVTAVSAVNPSPAMTASISTRELGLANATGNLVSGNGDNTAMSGASFGSSGGTERGGAASGSSPGSSAVRGPLTPFQENKLVQRVLRGFEQLQDGGGQVRLRLHPPELGTLQMTLRIESMQVSARLEVENTVARDALIQNAQTLRDQLAAQGFEVERFEVEIRSEVGGDSTGLEQRSDRRGEESRYQSLESRYAAMQANRVAGDSSEQQPPPARTAWFRNGNNLDLTV